MPNSQGRVSIVFDADTAQAKAKIQDLSNSLNKIMSQGTQSTGVNSLDKQLQQAAKDAATLKVQLQNAVNVKTGNLDLTKFNESLQASGMSLEKYQASFANLGSAGDQAFTQLARSIATAEIPLRRSSQLLDDFAISLKNTVKWQISSSIMHGFMSTIQGALSYAQNLNENLNNIRIVTGQSADQMARFAEQANRSARELSTTTNAYTQASLIFYQQGLDDKAVKARTDTVIKMANVTKDSAQDVSSYMTAIWNNFADGSKELEYYGDVIAALGAKTASSSAEIAGGLEKFASIGEQIGLSYEYAASALSTIVAQTRQSEDTVGTSLRTIFARLQGLSLGETLEDGTNLNKYSAALAKVGVEIKDASGQLKDMDAILDDLGSRWQNLSKDTQVALAQTVAGVRQYTTLVALMDNWDFMQNNVSIAKGSEGTLQEQADIYAESWEAAQNRVRTALESIYDALINDKFFIDMNDMFTSLLNGVKALIDGLGGLPGVISSLGSIILTVFDKQIAASLKNATYNIKMMTKSGQDELISLQQRAQTLLKSQNQGKSTGDKAIQSAYQSEAKVQLALIDNAKKLSAEEKAIADILIQQHQTRLDEQLASGEELNNLEKIYQRQTNVFEDAQNRVVDLLVEMDKKPEGFANLLVDLTNLSTKIQAVEQDYSVLNAALEQSMAATGAGGSEADRAQALLQQIQQIKGELKGEGKEIAEQFVKDMEAAAGAPDKVVLALQNFEKGFGSLTNTLVANRDKVEGVFEAMKKMAEGNTELLSAIRLVENAYRQMINTSDKLAETRERSAKANADVAMSEKAVMDALKASKATYLDAQQAIVAFGQVISTIGSIVNSFKGLKESFKEGNLTVSQFLTTVGFLIPQIVRLAANLKNLSLSFLGAIAQGKLFASANASATVSSYLAAEGVTTLGMAIKAAFPILAGIVIAVGLVAAAIYKLYKALTAESDVEKATKRLEELKQENNKLAQEIRNTTQEIENMYNEFDEYEDAYNALNELTVGTENWATALANVKQMTQQLISSYPILADMIANPDEYDMTLGEIFDENGDLRPEILSIVEERSKKRANLMTFGKAAAGLGNKEEEIANQETLYQSSRESFESTFNGTAGGDWGKEYNPGGYNAGYTGLVGSNAFRYFTNIPEYYASLPEEVRAGFVKNSDFFNSSTLLALNGNDVYSGEVVEYLSDIAYNIWQQGGKAFLDEIEASDEVKELYGYYADENEYFHTEPIIPNGTFTSIDESVLRTGLSEMDRLGLNYYDNPEINERSSIMISVLNGLLKQQNAITDISGNLEGLTSGTGSAFLSQLGFIDEKGNRRAASSYSAIDAIVGRAIVQNLEQYSDYGLPTEEELSDIFSLTGNDTIKRDRKTGNYTITLKENAEDEGESAEFSSDQMLVAYRMQLMAEDIRENEDITDVGSYLRYVDPKISEASATALNRYDTYGLNGLHLEDIRALGEEAIRPYLVDVIDETQRATWQSAMETASGDLKADYDYGTVNKLYGVGETDPVYVALRNAIGVINEKSATPVSQSDITAIVNAVNSGDIEEATRILYGYGEAAQQAKNEITDFSTAAYQGYVTINKYSNLAENFDDTAEAIHKLNEKNGVINQKAYDALVASGIDVSGVKQVGSDKYSGIASWDKVIEDYYISRSAIDKVDAGVYSMSARDRRLADYEAMSTAEMRALGYTGSSGGFADYIESEEGKAALAAARFGTENFSEDWLINEATTYGFQYLDTLRNQGVVITTEIMQAMAKAQAEIDGIELNDSDLTGINSKEDYDRILKDINLDKATSELISNYANLYGTDLYKNFKEKGYEGLTRTDKATIDAFRQNVSDVFGDGIKEISDEHLMAIMEAAATGDVDNLNKALEAAGLDQVSAESPYVQAILENTKTTVEKVMSLASKNVLDSFEDGDYSNIKGSEIQKFKNEFGATAAEALNNTDFINQLVEQGILIEDSKSDTGYSVAEAYADLYDTTQEAVEALYADLDNQQSYLDSFLDTSTTFNRRRANVLTSTEGFNGQYSGQDARNVTTALEGATKYGGTKAANALGKMMSEAGSRASELAAALAGINWQTAGIDDVNKALQDAGFYTNDWESEIATLISGLEAAIEFTNSLTSALENYASQTSIADKIRNGDSITAEEYAEMEKMFGVNEATEMFRRQADGTYLAESDNGLLANEIEFRLLSAMGTMADEWQGTLGYANMLMTGERRGISVAEENVPYLNNILGLLGENLKLFGLEGEQATQAKEAIDTYSGDRSVENQRAMLEALGISDMGSLMEVLMPYINKNAQEAQEVVQDATTAIPKENFETAVSKVDLNIEEVNELAKALKELPEYADDSFESLQKMAKAQLRWNRSVEAGEKNLEDWKKDLKTVTDKGLNDFADSIDDVQKAYEDLLDIDFGSLKKDFMLDPKNMELYEKAIEGDTEALKEFQLAAADNIYFGTDGLGEQIQTITDEAGEVILEIGVDEASMDAALAEIQSMIPEDTTVDVDANLEPINAKLEELKFSTYDAAVAANQSLSAIGVDADIIPVTQTVPGKSVTTTQSGSFEAFNQADGTTTTVTVSGSSTLTEDPYDQTYYILQGKGFKPSGGSGGKTSGGGGRGGGGRRGGGGGSRKPRADKKEDKDKERYHTIRNQLEDLTDIYDKVDKAADRAFGKSKIKLLKEQEKAVADLAAKQRDYIKEIEDYYKKDKAALSQVTDFTGIGIKFDENGTITNFDQIQDKMFAMYNSHINSNGEVADMDEDAWKEYEKKWQDIMDLITQYDETQDLWKEAKQQLQDYINELYDLQLEEITYSVEVKIDVTDDKLEILDYMLGRIEDDAWKAAEAIAYMGQQADEMLLQNKTYNSGIEQILMNHTRDLKDSSGNVLQKAQLTEADVQGILNGDAGALEKLMQLNDYFTDDEVQAIRDYTSSLIDLNESLAELREDVIGKVLDTFNAFNDELDRSIDKIDHLAQLTKNYSNIVDIVGAKNLGITKTLMDTVGQAQVDIAIDRVEATRSKMLTIQDEVAKAEQALAEAKSKGLEEDVRLWEENLKEMHDALDEAEEDFMQSWEDALTSINEEFEKAVGRIVDTLSDALAGPLNGSLEQLRDLFDQQQTVADRYLPEYEKIYQLNKLNRDIQNSIDDTDNIRAKQELAALQAEINALEESGVEISEYQAEQLRKRYELKLAELTLEEAQNAKSEVRMSRDADGNWSYVYTASEDDVANAEQNYEDKLREYQQLNADYINSLQEQMIQFEEEIAAKIDEIWSDETLSMEEKMARTEQLREYYGEQMEYYLSELGIVLEDNQRLYEDDWMKYHELTGYKIADEEDWMTHFNQLPISLLTGFDTMEEYQDAFNNAISDALDSLSSEYDRWYDNTERAFEAAGTTMDDYADLMEEDVEKIVEASHDATDAIDEMGQQAKDTFNDLIQAVTNWEDAYSKMIDSILERNEALAKSFNEVLKAWAGFEEYGGIDDSNDPRNNDDDSDSGESDSGPQPAQLTPKQKAEMYGKGVAAAIWSARGGAGWGNGGTRKARVREKGMDYDIVQGYVNKLSGKSSSYNVQFAGVGSLAELESKYKYSNFAFDTGGYTGAWGSEGKFAMLHEKEIVLNKDDTKNFLAAMGIVRDIADVIDLNAYSAAGYGSVLGKAGTVAGMGQELEQNVHIEASFPNATDKDEILSAFDELVNLASQYAGRK